MNNQDDLDKQAKQESVVSPDNMYYVITRHQRTDPFQESGIQKDWVCVVHPAMHRILREMQFENPRTLGDNIAGHPVFYNSKAPNGKFAFYSPQKARELFADDNDIIAYLNTVDRK